MKIVGIFLVVAAIVLTFMFLQGRRHHGSGEKSFEGYVNENITTPDTTNNAVPAQVNMKF